MQNAKDTFYETLRARLAIFNPERTMVVRGVVRPAVLVEENELVSAFTPPDCFRLRWSKATSRSEGPLTLITQLCQIDYETAGTTEYGGMDRGRVLAAMDDELLSIVNAVPRSTAKVNYTGLGSDGAIETMATNVWWSEVALGTAEIKQDRVARSATINVMSYEEAGER